MVCNKCSKSIPEKLDYCPSCKMAQLQGYSSYKDKLESKKKNNKQPNQTLELFIELIVIALVIASFYFVLILGKPGTISIVLGIYIFLGVILLTWWLNTSSKTRRDIILFRLFFSFLIRK